jgi:valyl-tRNA synthetase
MSKSKGNIVEPQVMIEKYSADALRFWSAGSKLGDDLPFQEKDLVTGQKLITKLWNASRFCFMHLEDYKDKKIELEVIDKWFLSSLSKIIKSSTESFDNYEYSKTKLEVETFFWHSFCDNYLEIVKDRLYNPDKRGEPQRKSAQYGLYHGLLAILKMFAPIMPHITEEIYHLYYAEKEGKKSIHNSLWPEAILEDEEAERIGGLVLYAVGNARKAKTEKNLSLKTPVKYMKLQAKIASEDFELVSEDIRGAAGVETIEYEELNKDSEVEFSHELEIE